MNREATTKDALEELLKNRLAIHTQLDRVDLMIDLLRAELERAQTTKVADHD